MPGLERAAPLDRAAPRVSVRCVPATPERWEDLEALFGPRGACAGCWCMYWRRSARAYEAGKGDENREALRALVGSGEPPGLLAYREDRAVGWCSVGPRAAYPRLENSRILKPVDERPVWSVVCLFVERPQRRRGVSVALLRGAADYAAARGADWLEGYPVEPADGRAPDAFVWTGLAAAYRRAGFEEVARRSPTRPIMRKALRPAAASPRA